ncbi:hypothetical protein [Ornithinimicrobium murale]|uniref:hypothetical protein n=1 Tax=Ornithinimicrobium murale TaxID=1050153 RepID=UPI000E0D40B1|nr:hypothetical protein [Ornithinimicrobium murale]
MTFDNEPQGPEQGPSQVPSARANRAARNKRQAWLYIVIGVVLGVVAVLGLLADDRGFLDWALLVLAIANLVMGVMAVRSPEPRVPEPTDD